MKRVLALILWGMMTAGWSPAQEHGIINNAKSPHVMLRSTDIGDCRWTSGFWADKFQICEETMVPHMGSLLKGDVGHAYNNFKIAARLKEGTHQGTPWHDGDFYKWMEAAAYVYAINKDESIVDELDEVINVVGKAQADDGYLHTAVMIKELGRYTKRGHHEMYNSGHLLTSACIHHRVTGKRNFLNIAIKHADHLYETFSPRPKELARFGFNQTQIMGLVELYRTTGDKRYFVRTIAKVSGWAYSLSDNGVAVNLYGGNELNTRMLDGSVLRLRQETQYPWDGRVGITIDECKDAPFEVMLRIPGWADEAHVLVNGKNVSVAAQPGSYAKINRRWKPGDVVNLDMPMDVTLIEGHPRIEEVRNQVAIKRGPVVYCIETPDLPDGTGILDVYLPENSRLTAKYRPGFLGGMTTIRGNVLLRSVEEESMYRALTKPEWETVKTTFVPYFAWSNRGQSEMTVWMPIVWE